MIFRAIFWIGLVALLMPHEPDLGFGRPAQVGSNVAGDVASWAKDKLQPDLKDPQNLCRYNTDACAAGGAWHPLRPPQDRDDRDGVDW